MPIRRKHVFLQRTSNSVSRDRSVSNLKVQKLTSVHRAHSVFTKWHIKDSKMVLQDSDDDIGVKFELPRDHEKMQKVLQEYEELLTACLVEIEQFREKSFSSNFLVNGKSIELSMLLKLANEARHIVAFIEKETEQKALGQLCSIANNIRDQRMLEDFSRLGIINNKQMFISNVLGNEWTYLL